MKKKVLVTGLNSYVGNSFAKLCSDDFEIDKISVRDHSWQELDFSKYDSVLHVAGIAHTSKNPKLESLYYQINTDLTYQIAKKAQTSGVKQFIFMSSIIVYGDSALVGQQKIIDKNTEPKPEDFYGDSKLKAEQKLNSLQDDNFNVVILRPPMIYGEGSKGNYSKLVKLAKYTFIFPDIKNQRSVLHAGKLCEILKNIIQKDSKGVFYPQDDEYFCTSEFIKKYRQEKLGKKTYLTKAFNPIIKLMAQKFQFLNKLFGNCKYEL